MSWERSAVPERDGALGLLDMDPSGALPKGATVIDVLAWALSLPGSEDVITGMVDAVSLELATLAGVVPERRLADVLPDARAASRRGEFAPQVERQPRQITDRTRSE